MQTHRTFLSAAIFTIVTFASSASAEVKPIFSSQPVTSRTDGHAVKVEVDVTGAKQLYLVVTDASDGYGCDWADWAEPRLIGSFGEKRLTELKWKSAAAGWGNVYIDKNAGGQPMRINGRDVSYGIGTHANSMIVYDLPPGSKQFLAHAGLDNGGTDQQGGGASSVVFKVFLERPSTRFLIASGSGGSSASHDPDEAVESLEVAESLQAELFASEPMIVSLTNLDVDHRGRVWVCDVVNYRGRNGTRPEGDRILILEDTNGDGKADRSKVFYQGRDIDSAMGVCVLGNRVIVTCSPNVFMFIDENGDDKPDRKELLFSKTGDAQHDHGAHAFLFGPDGKLYWNFGNNGRAVHDPLGNPVVDLDGNVVTASGKPFRQGMAFRCNLDGTGLEVLGYNFRNNYELTVDSFGTVWQSDNDDDGNRGVRINYVMRHGNFGYTDEKTGAGWKTPRTGWHDEIPMRHWHQNDPGVVPNLLVTGAGSPSGICIYEGNLLPEVFRGQMIHAEAGPNAVQAYPVTRNGAGYQAEIEPILRGTWDKWFRPVDVCVAPDGSLFVADWYDPGVGGHGMQDLERGRVFRVAPPKIPYRVPSFDFSTPDGACKALVNPNRAVLYMAWTSLQRMGSKAEPALAKLWRSKNPRHRARALWLLGRIDSRGESYLNEALRDADPDLRITGLRLAQQLRIDPVHSIEPLVNDRSAQVRRECAIGLWHVESPQVPRLWAELASHHDGRDRWYLEALGIGADGQWDACLDAWLERVGDKWNTPSGRDVIWRSRAMKTSELLVRILRDPSVPTDELPRYLRAFDFLEGPSKEEALVELAFGKSSGDPQRRQRVVLEAIRRISPGRIDERPEYRQVLLRVLDQIRGELRYIELVEKFNVRERYDDLLTLAREPSEGELGVKAIRTLLGRDESERIAQSLSLDRQETVLATTRVLGLSGDGRAVPLLWAVVNDAERPLAFRREAIRSLGLIRNGAKELIEAVEQNRLDERLKSATAAALHRASWNDVRQKAARHFPLPPSKEKQPLPSIHELVRIHGNAKNGLLVFREAGTCAKCHQINGEGEQIGPDLSEIGTKLSREAIFESIVYPNAAINVNFESYVLETDDGNLVTGLVTSRTDKSISLKSADGIVRTFPMSDVVELFKQTISLMPADLPTTMTAQELADVVNYLSRQTMKMPSEP